MKKNKNIIFVAGVSGVGKTTFLKKIAENAEFQRLTASLIIKEQRKYIGVQKMTSEELRLANLADNQKVLVDGFHRLKIPQMDLIIIDGHTVIDTPNGLIKIESSVFKGLGVEHFIFLKEQPAEILKRRRADSSRNRHSISAELIEQQQAKSLVVTAKIAEVLGVPMSILNTCQSDDALRILKNLIGVVHGPYQKSKTSHSED